MSNVWRGVDEVPTDLGPTVVTIGVFDGVHRGHRVIVDRALAAARTAGATEAANRLPVVVVTFDPHPSEVVRPGSHPAMLSTLEHRVELLRAAGADDVLVLHFSASLARLTPGEFVRDVLVDRLHAVVGRRRGQLPVRAPGRRHVDDARRARGSPWASRSSAVGLVGEGRGPLVLDVRPPVRRRGRHRGGDRGPRPTAPRRGRGRPRRPPRTRARLPDGEPARPPARRRPGRRHLRRLAGPAFGGAAAGGHQHRHQPDVRRRPSAAWRRTASTATGLDLYGERVALDFGAAAPGDAEVRRRRRAARADGRRRRAGARALTAG